MEKRKYLRAGKLVTREYDYNQIRVRDKTKKRVKNYAKRKGLPMRAVVELAMLEYFRNHP